MIVELCSRRNRALSPLPRQQRVTHESFADPVTAIQFVKDGCAPLLQIHPQPMTVEQAATWLADFEL
jgi:hypothetical protein